MKYVSTRNNKKTFKFRDVFIKGLADDGGLFIPESLRKYSETEISSFKKREYNDLAKKIISTFIGDFMSENDLSNIIDKSYSVFRKKNVVNLIKVGDRSVLELFHGPTLAFKDVAMQLLGNFYEYYLNNENQKINIVVATSGDTGAAAISAIKDRKNMKIFVLHPDNKISEVQRKFMTTVNSDNVFNIAIASNFDECQKFVKDMFADKNFCTSINMSGVNSINWARIIMQIVYYFFSYFKVAKNLEKINFSVPTGNFGNVYAGYIARKMGLPINKLILATNSNDILKRVMQTGVYKPLKVEHTVSPSMDIQVASNFERLIFDICSKNPEKIIKLMKDLKRLGEFKLEKEEIIKIKEIFCAESLSEEETKLVIKKIYKDQGKLIDPHTAVAIGAVDKVSIEGEVIVLGTAHPCKFSKVVSNQTGIKPELPESLRNILIEKESFVRLPKDLKKIQKYILEKI